LKFLLIISHDDSFIPTDSLIKGIGAWIRKMERKGARIYGNPLRPAAEGMTVRIRNGMPKVTRGPFANSKEKMCAYELMECSSREQAIEFAKGHPMASAATIEVRQVWDDLAG
jgi:hypothetical protein